MRLSRLLGIAALLLVVASERPARANEQSEVEKARASYLAQKYDDAESRLRAMLDPKTGTLHDPTLITTARMYLSAVLLAKHKPDEAEAVIERLLLDDPQYEPDPLSFPTDLIDLFIDVRARARETLNREAARKARFEAELKAHEEELKRREAARIAMLERMVNDETVTTVHSRWLALVPFGVGQFQNGKPTLGWVFLTLESALLLGAGITIPIYLSDLQSRSEAYRKGEDFQAQEYIDRAYGVFYTNLALNGAFAATAIVGIVEAQLNYLPSVVEMRRRTIPAMPPVTTPLVSPSPDGHGAIVGLVGRF